MVRATANVFLATILLLVGLVSSALGTAGVVNVKAAHILLVIAWVACVAGVCTAEAFASKTLRHILTLGLITAVVSGVILYQVDRWMVNRKSDQERTQSSNPSPLTSPGTVNIARDIAQSRGPNYPETSSESSPVLRRYKTRSGITTICKDPPLHPVLNYWPISYTKQGESCHDFPFIDARLVKSEEYAASKEEWLRGLTANSGDEIFILIYLNNGAANGGLDPSVTLAKNIAVTIQTDIKPGETHYVDVSASGDNVETIYARFKIKTSGNECLEIVPNSGEVFNAYEVLLTKGFDLGNNTVRVGDLRPNFEDCLFLRYRVRVIHST